MKEWCFNKKLFCVFKEWLHLHLHLHYTSMLVIQPKVMSNMKTEVYHLFSHVGEIPWLAKEQPASQEEHVFLLRREDRFWEKWSMLVKSYGKKISKKVKKKYSEGSQQKAFALLCIQEGKQHKEYYIMKLFFSLVFLLPVRYDCRNNVHHTYKHTTVPLLYMLLYSDSSLFPIHHPHFSCRKGFSLGKYFSHLFP